MSDAQRRYQEIRKSLSGLYGFEADGNVARHLNTMTAMISGIIGSQRTNLPQVASKVSHPGILRDSQIKRFSRWVNNSKIEQAVYFLPYTQALLSCFSKLPITLIMDGSAVGRGCKALVINLVYRKRALPLAFVVREGKKGHFAETDHLTLVERVEPLLPAKAEVTFLGDGEFDGVDLLTRISSYHWHYVCRTAKNSVVQVGTPPFQLQTQTPEQGCYNPLKNVLFTDNAYGPVHAVIWWEKGYDEPLYLITNIPDLIRAANLYKKRFRIETFFSDTKSRGFHIHKSHLSDPDRLERLMIPACLAYLWIIYLGSIAEDGGYIYFIHRLKRCDLSLFQLGLRLLDNFLNDDEDFPDDFHLWEF